MFVRSPRATISRLGEPESKGGAGACRSKCVHRIAYSHRDVLELCGAACLAALALAVVLVLRIGPVLLVLGQGRGVHSGDALGVLFAAAALALMAHGSARRSAARQLVAARG
jgi:hypothetical protein